MYKRKVLIHEDIDYLNLVKRTIERDYNDIKEPIFLIDVVVEPYRNEVKILAYGENHTKEKADEFLNWIYENYNKEE